jgi:hypothetical protein
VEKPIHTYIPRIMADDTDTSANLKENENKNSLPSDPEVGDDNVEEIKVEEVEPVANDENDDDDDRPWKDRYIEVLQAFWPLGWVAFGGPQAHVAMLRVHLVCSYFLFRCLFLLLCVLKTPIQILVI